MVAGITVDDRQLVTKSKVIFTNNNMMKSAWEFFSKKRVPSRKEVSRTHTHTKTDILLETNRWTQNQEDYVTEIDKKVI